MKYLVILLYGANNILEASNLLLLFQLKGGLTRNDLYDTICMTLIVSATLSGIETLKYPPFHGICLFVEIFSFFNLVSDFFSK